MTEQRREQEKAEKPEAPAKGSAKDTSERSTRSEPAPERSKDPSPGRATAAPAAALNVTCDCTLFPYLPDPPCSKQCTSKIVLATATLDELVLIVGVNADAARRVVDLKEGLRPSTLEPYSKVLTPAQLENLHERLHQLNEPQANYFRLPPGERTERLRRIKSLLNPEVLGRLFAERSAN